MEWVDRCNEIIKDRPRRLIWFIVLSIVANAMYFYFVVYQ